MYNVLHLNDFGCYFYKKKLLGKYNTLDIKPLAILCDRYGISDRACAALATSTLEISGTISPENRNLIIDRSKLRRSRNKAREELQSENITNVVGLFFDSKKDKTLYVKKDESYITRDTRTEEHVSLVAEPGGRYLGHITPLSGTAENVSNGIFSFLSERKNCENIYAAGCDGTNCNTGVNGGISQITNFHLFIRY